MRSVKVMSSIVGLLVAGGTASAQPVIYGLTTTDRLVSFNPSAPGSLLSDVAISGLGSGERIEGLDFRPATGQLFALTSAARLVTVNPFSGAATAVPNTGNAISLAGTRFGLDFNPRPDRIRLVSNADTNQRLNPNTGGLVSNDASVAYDSSDAGFGQNPNLVAVAYTNSEILGGPVSSTTMYAIDSARQALVRQGSLDGSPISPDTGRLFTVGNYFGLTPDPELVGFDIFTQGGVDTAFMTLTNLLGGTALYEIALTGPSAGSNTFLGNPGLNNFKLRDIAVTNGRVAVVIPLPSAGLAGLAGMALVASRRRRA